MEKKGQYGLEFLMTYGWTAVLLMAILSIMLVFVTPELNKIEFSSSEPLKIIVKATNATETKIWLQLTNATGGMLLPTNVTSTGFYDCEIANNPATAGNEISISCTIPTEKKGCIILHYKDKDNYNKQTIFSTKEAGNCIPEIFEYANSNDSGYIQCQSGTWCAQTFSPQKPYKINNVKLMLSKTGNPGTITASISATDSSGLPKGQDLCAGTTNSNTMEEGIDEWREITLGKGCDLNAGTTYAIILKAQSGNEENAVWFSFANNGTYQDGKMIVSWDGSGENWTEHDSQWDFMFENYGFPS